MITECLKCGIDASGGLLGGYCPTCWPDGLWAMGIERIDIHETIEVKDGETAHDALLQAIKDGRATPIARA